MMDVLEQRRGDYVDRRLIFHLLDTDIDNSPQSCVLALQQFGDGEEKLSSLIFGEVLALVEEVYEVGECADALVSIEVSVVETSGVVHGR
jgi:hypothetical protein